MKAVPQIVKYMTTVPQTLNQDCNVERAIKLMHDHGFRHIPVLKQNRLVGLVSQRDLLLVQSIKGFDPKTETIEQVMTESPFTVSPTTPLDEVCLIMAEKKYGCVIVEDNHHVVGIFTWVDALKAMNNLFETRLK